MVVSELYRGVYWVLRGSVGWSCGSCELTDNTVELMWLSAVTPRMTVCGDYLINDGVIADLARCGPHGDLPWPIKMIGTLESRSCPQTPNSPGARHDGTADPARTLRSAIDICPLHQVYIRALQKVERSRPKVSRTKRLVTLSRKQQNAR